MRRKVDVEGIVAFRGNELAEDSVSFFIGRVRRNSAEALRHAIDVGIHGEGRKDRTNVYGTCLISLKVWNIRKRAWRHAAT